MGKYVCKECGSDNVEIKTFVNLNTHEFVILDKVDDEDTWCMSCEDHTGVEYVEKDDE